MIQFYSPVSLGRADVQSSVILARMAETKLESVAACLLVVRSVSAAGRFLLPADGADGVRFGLQGHAKFGSDSRNGSWRELKMKPLQQSGEKEEHLHPGQLFTQAVTPPWKKKMH